jgi:hypothetical protein
MPREQNDGDECEHGGRHSHHFRRHSHRFNRYRYRYIYISVADPGCLSRIPDPTFFIPDSVSEKLSEIWSGLFIPDPGRIRILIFLYIPDPGSKGQKGSGSATLIYIHSQGCGSGLGWVWIFFGKCSYFTLILEKCHFKFFFLQFRFFSLGRDTEFYNSLKCLKIKVASEAWYKFSVADPDPRSGAFWPLDPGSGISFFHIPDSSSMVFLRV